MPENEAATKTRKAAEKEQDRFARERLVAEAQDLLGERPFIVAGALADSKGKSDLTLDEARAAIDKYRKRDQKEA